MLDTLATLAGLLPFGYAFTAGVATMVSPCSIAMLPAYMSMYLRDQDDAFRAKSVLRRTGRAMAMGGMVTLGFVALFGFMGIILSIGGQALMKVVPWMAVLIAAVLLVMGIYLIAGGSVYYSLPARLSTRIGVNGGATPKAFLLFGIAYAIAALSCTIPVFLVVVGTTLAVKGPAFGLLQFVSYSLGMGLVITVVTVASALFRETVNRWLRRIAPMVSRFSGLLLIWAGAYILYYWFSAGDILKYTISAAIQYWLT